MFIELKESSLGLDVTIALDKIITFHDSGEDETKTIIFLEGSVIVIVLEDYQTVKEKVIDCINEWHAND